MQLCVYCASSNLIAPAYFDLARSMGAELAKRGWTLVYGGGSVGLMGALAQAVQQNGGKVIGVIPQALLDREIAYLPADELIVTTTLRERKRLMDDYADAFVALPGGFGTMEELLEIMTLRQLAYHDKPIVIVNSGGYFDPMLEQFERIFAERFAQQRYRDLYRVVDGIAEVFQLLDGLGTGGAEG